MVCVKNLMCVQNTDKLDEPFSPSAWSWTDTLESWTFDIPVGTPVVAEAYADADEVAFFVNGVEKARVAVGADIPYVARAAVAYEPGELKVVQYRNGVASGEFSVVTVESPAEIQLVDATDAAIDDSDVRFVEISVVDAQGNICVNTDFEISVSTEGRASLIGLGSAAPSQDGNFLGTTCTMYHGRALAAVSVVKTGSLRVSTADKKLGAELKF